METSPARKVHLISLGCARNRVDAEVMLGSLFQRGWQNSEDAAGSDAIIINTCGFIQSAKEESVDTILEAAALKKDHPGLKLIVTGCLSQRYKGQLARGLPEVDMFLGTDEFARIADLLDTPPPRGTVFAKRTHYLYSETLPRVNTLARHAAYVKVAEGCQHNCSFCIIPAIRGRLRSRPIASVVREVEALVAEGVVEVNLIAQDLAAYGRDHGTDQLLPLLRALVQVEGLEWVRLMYMYPENISEEFLEFLAAEPKIVKYLDIPMQHGSDTVLARMNRQVTRAELIAKIERVRARIPGMAIRTSVMVGFPGETAAEFEELKSFVQTMAFDHLGCFTYSQEEGTVAGRMQDQIPEDVKSERQAEIMAMQQNVSRQALQRYIGQIVAVLVEGTSAESEYVWEGRLATQAPEVDGKVYLEDGPVGAGRIQNVRITRAYEYDLVGEVLH